jgi:hypothetical protein
VREYKKKHKRERDKKSERIEGKTHERESEI